MRKYGKSWEYVAVYLDDLVFVVRDPSQFVKELEDTNTYKLKKVLEVSPSTLDAISSEIQAVSFSWPQGNISRR